jgi:hypothetical protein
MSAVFRGDDEALWQPERWVRIEPLMRCLTGLEASAMQDRTPDDLDGAIILLAVRAHDLAERDLDVPENTEQLRTTALAILRSLDERERLAAGQPVAV